MQMIRVVWVVFLLGLGVTGISSAQDEGFTGYIAFIGEDYNVYVVGNEFNSPTALTTDANFIRRYQFPTWSTDGRLAFFCCNVQYSPQTNIEAYVASADLTAPKLLYQARNEGYTYSYWSPADCNAGIGCRDLALLLTRPSTSFKVEILRQTDIGSELRETSTGAPFYFSWSSDGQRMLWYRNNRLLSYFDVETSIITDSTERPLFFQAPAWSPIDGRAAVTLLAEDEQSTTLTILEPDGSVLPLRTGLQGLTNFSWSPDGRYIAYRLLTADGITAVQVIDSTTGESAAFSTEQNVIAFFWSPDGSKLAYLTPSVTGGVQGGQTINNVAQVQGQRFTLAWNILNIETNQNQLLTSFEPTDTMLYLLGYFDQFSQSHRVWSPDSRHLVYGEVVRDGQNPVQQVAVLDTLAERPASVSIANGEIGIWSYR